MAKEMEMASALAGKGKPMPKKAVGEKPKIHSTHIRHTPDGGHHVVHYHEKGSSSHFVPHGNAGPGDLENLHAHLENELGSPNAGESELPEGIIKHNPAGGTANLGPEAAPAPGGATPPAAV